MPTWYEIGDQPRITCTFTNLAGTVTDPTSVTCTVKTPSGTSTTYTYGVDAILTRTSTGIYNLDLYLEQSREYNYKWAGVGALISADQGKIPVRKSNV